MTLYKTANTRTRTSWVVTILTMTCLGKLSEYVTYYKVVWCQGKQVAHASEPPDYKLKLTREFKPTRLS